MITTERWTDVVQLLRAAARTEIMPRFRKLAPGAIRAKTGPNDLVTEADVAAEVMITTGLQLLFPGCLVVGEEATSANPSLLDRLATADMAFVVDPVDGTSNFVAGLPLFGVMAAAVSHGAVAAAAIYDPIGDDTAVALQGQGAWMWAADGSATPLHVAAPAAPAAMTGCISWRYMAPKLRAAVVHNMVGLAGVADYRCAAHQYRMLAAGHCDYLVFNRLMPWDHLPGWLLHQEAGGYSAHFDGSPYRPGDLTGGLICAADEASYGALRVALMEGS
jgi:fructose-1,6-bisphosphatase/inositol monophosphatase family enzyme